MENIFMSQLENSRNAIKYWWLLLLLGIAIFIMGIIVFMYPGMSYLGLSMAFGIIILASGITHIVISSSNKGLVIGRGWLLVEGIIEVILGLILSFNFAISAVTLPIFLGFWLLFKSFGLIGAGSDMSSLKISGYGWTIITGVLLLICSIIILIQPMVYGISAVVIWVGASFLVAGISLAIFSFQLKNVHKHFNKILKDK